MTEKPEFRVLALDGGGMRGTYAASLLATLERDLGPVVGNFDLICGTSTGGLIALGLGAGKSAREILDFYRLKGTSIFLQEGRIKGWDNLVRGLTKRHKYEDAGLQAAVEGVFGDKRMKDAAVDLCIPAVDFLTYRPWVFKTGHDPISARDGDVLMRDVALATSAAPMFFPVATAYIPAHRTHHRFVDGGVYANCPVMVGLTEALRFFVGDGKPYGSLRILSVGVPEESVGNADTGSYRPLLLEWPPTWPPKLLPYVTQILDLTMTSQMASALYTARYIGEALPYPFLLKRLEPERLSAAQARIVKLDGVSSEALSTLTQLGSQDAQRMKEDPEVRSFFQPRSP